MTAPESPGAAISVSSIGMPMRSRAGSASVRRASTRTSPGELDVADAVGLEVVARRPAYGGDFGAKHWIVQLHSVPRRCSRRSSTSSEVQRGQDAWRGKVTVAHRRQLDPMSSGSCAVPAIRPSATGTNSR